VLAQIAGFGTQSATVIARKAGVAALDGVGLLTATGQVPKPNVRARASAGSAIDAAAEVLRVVGAEAGISAALLASAATRSAVSARAATGRAVRISVTVEGQP
jgi:hypothetical protein